MNDVVRSTAWRSSISFPETMREMSRRSSISLVWFPTARSIAALARWIFGSSVAALLEYLRRHQNRAERRAELVRQRGEKEILGAVGLLRLESCLFLGSARSSRRRSVMSSMASKSIESPPASWIGQPATRNDPCGCALGACTGPRVPEGARAVEAPFDRFAKCGHIPGPAASSKSRGRSIARPYARKSPGEGVVGRHDAEAPVEHEEGHRHGLDDAFARSRGHALLPVARASTRRRRRNESMAPSSRLSVVR